MSLGVASQDFLEHVWLVKLSSLQLVLPWERCTVREHCQKEGLVVYFSVLIQYLEKADGHKLEKQWFRLVHGYPSTMNYHEVPAPNEPVCSLVVVVFHAT